MSTPTTDTDGLLLRGLDGSNPLGFLAALGTLQIAQKADCSRRIAMKWEAYGVRYSPRLIGSVSSESELVAMLSANLPKMAGSPWDLSKKLPFESERLNEVARSSAGSASMKDREEVDAISSLGSEVLVDDTGQFADTLLRMVRSGDSAGQGMLDYAQKIRANTSDDDLHHALFEQWHYAASGSSLRWDPAEARDYALLASDPSKDGALSVIGANRLALEAMVFFTTCPVQGKLATVGFHQFASGTAMTWPLWTVPLTFRLIHSLLTLVCLAAPQPPAEELKPRGVAVVFRSQRFKPNQYYSNFTPARAVMT